MYFLICVSIFLALFNRNGGTNMNMDDINEELAINDVAEGFVSLLGVNDEDKEPARIKELKEKIRKIDSYVLDKDKYTKLLINKTKDTDLNQTNFFEALNERDHFQSITNDSKNLYLKLKEKMNRDDVLKIVADRGEGRAMKSARRMINEAFVPRKHGERAMEEVVDKMLAETANDDHKYDEEDHYSKYWDPELELQELNDYHRHDGRRLYKGERTTVRYYPFMVSIHVMGRFWCGGVIYWQDLVLTSAACLQLMHNNRFFRENPRVLAVRVGSNHSRIGGELIDALEVYFHPGYNPRTLRNNIAVIRLRRHLRFAYHRVPKMIDISHNSDGISSTNEVLLLGWGVTKMSQKLAYEPIFLQRKFLPVYPKEFCKEVYGDKFVQSTMFCAGTLTTGEGACDHDAGGPAILYGKLVGIISFGPTVCGYPNVPTAFTLVGAFDDWIETVNESMPEYYRGKKRTTTTTPYTIPDMFTVDEYVRPITTHRTTTTTTQRPTTITLPPPPPSKETTGGPHPTPSTEEPKLSTTPSSLRIKKQAIRILKEKEYKDKFYRARNGKGVKELKNTKETVADDGLDIELD